MIPKEFEEIEEDETLGDDGDRGQEDAQVETVAVIPVEHIQAAQQRWSELMKGVTVHELHIAAGCADFFVRPS